MMFEQSHRLCGRLTSYLVNGTVVEFGGAIFHETNSIIDTIRSEYGLQRVKAFDDDGFGVWNGTHFAVRATDLSLWTKLELLWRYRFAPVYAQWESQSFLRSFKKLYKTPFHSVEELLDIAKIDPLARVSMADWLKTHKYNKQFGTELVEGATRINYGQNLHMSALGAWVSLVGSEDSVYAVVNGNEQLCYKIAGIDHAPVQASAGIPTGTLPPVTSGKLQTVRTATVRAISSRPNGRYSVTYERGGHTVQSTFDAVVIATPLEATNITFEAIDLPPSTSQRRPYQRTFVTIVHGEVNPAYFGLETPRQLPATVITTEPQSNAPVAPAEPNSISGVTTSQLPFTSFSLLHRRDNVTSDGTRFEGVYKFFSPVELSAAQIAPVFRVVRDVFRKNFAAYPILSPTPSETPFPSIRVQKGLYYLNAIESAASAMEMEALSARSIAKMIEEDFLK
ncbi:hypothetical protein CAOG_01349 [Capsaspora owczarzaki ATCC 30864]|uniref:hypothetical protein n=1 Tax=Capsaspora owczarzaki (strain ATCC 30864) TaxID=595528 RepID=UPI00035231E6|nr:hypothetical protein CAOG_01349 [Capsaspora owczarzaki ATCC 30864]|eukprot:XP_004349869.2 hypothetical protein CAOG_01349 [Capsaspora owczarzaki ATCC 30864]